jgi:hypothetical protein
MSRAKRNDPYRFPLREQAVSWWPTPSADDLLALAQIFELAVIGAEHKGMWLLSGKISNTAKIIREMSETRRTMEDRS